MAATDAERGELAGAAPPPPISPARDRPEDLVARAIAPVKPQYLRPPPLLRPHGRAPARDAPGEAEGGGGEATPAAAVAGDGKKSKRQLKRERQQERRSARHLCPEVARTGDAAACKYGPSCRLSHDLQAFLEQKPEDLPGTCPFSGAGDPCPYGVACRFSKTHAPHSHPPRSPPPGEASAGDAKRTAMEVNGLSKDLQKLLWKDRVEYPKADEQLKLLGLVGGKNFKKHGAHLVGDDEVDAGGNPAAADAELRHAKKVKVPVDDAGTAVLAPSRAEGIATSSPVEKKLDEACDATGEDEHSDNAGTAILAPTRVEGIAASSPCEKKLDEASNATGEDECLENGGTTVPAPSRVEGIATLSSCEKKLVETCDAAGADGHLDEVGTAVLAPSRVEVIPILNPREKKLVDFRGKLYLAPLTTVGNLPFRRLCKSLGVDVTCGEMAMCTNLLQGQASEWALLRRHASEDLFGVQLCGAYPDTVSRAVELVDRECSFDFVDINMGCPIDVVVNKGAGSALLTKPMRMKSIIQAASRTTDRALTVKVRTGYFEGRNRVDTLVEDIGGWGAAAVTIHGRSRQQRYSKLADWDYINKCIGRAPDSLQVLGNGDVFSHLDWNKRFADCPRLSTCVIARGALIKPWIFTEIKEQRHWDITSGERFDILKKYVDFGLEHWGSDSKGVETTRHFLLEWLSYTCRYVPVGLLEVVPQRLNWRPPSYCGRDDLETLMASDSAADWVKISEMLLGKVPDGFTFAPKHKSNAYDRPENG